MHALSSSSSISAARGLKHISMRAAERGGLRHRARGVIRMLGHVLPFENVRHGIELLVVWRKATYETSSQTDHRRLLVTRSLFL